MSVQALSWVIENSKHKGNTFVVLLMIANHARSDGTGAWPSVQTLCKECRLARRTVQRCLSRLSKPWKFPIELRISVAKGPYGANLYEIPGVKLTQGGRQIGTGGASLSDAGGAPQVTPNPSLTVHKDKEMSPTLLAVRERLLARERKNVPTQLAAIRAKQRGAA
jgi:hypothetical protein